MSNEGPGTRAVHKRLNGEPKIRVRRNWALSEKELERIRNYNYKPGVYTYLDNKLTPYWNWAVTKLPPWAAPNLVTFTGLFAVVCWTALVVGRCQDLATPLPGWCAIGYACALFFYQTLDAIDGKQARRTNSSSPLGQLFDHGCDALVTLLCLVTVAATMRLGASWKVSKFAVHNDVISREIVHQLPIASAD
jgi:CDP-alcohol phosphatidyltransferase